MQNLEAMAATSPRIERSRNPIDRLSTAAGSFCGWLMLVAAGCIGYEIFSRAFLGHATSWVYDVTTYMVVWFTFISAASVLHFRNHLSVDLYVSWISPIVARSLELLGFLVVAIVTAVVLYYSATSTLWSYKVNELEPTILQAPVWMIHAGMVIGLALTLLQALREIIHVSQELVSLSKEGGAWQVAALNVFLAVACAALGAYVFSAGYEPLGLAVLLLSLLFFGVPIYASLMLAGLIGLYFVFGQKAGLTQVEQVSYKAALSNTLLAVPLYILAGNVLQAGRIGPELYRFASAWIGHIRGGYAVATILACGIFAAISGSSVATAATIGALAIPEMLKRGYEPRFVYGLVAAGGTLGILIPPSTPMILFSAMTNESTGALFMGGIVPGILMLLVFCVYAVFICGGAQEEKTTWPERMRVTRQAIWGLLAPVFVLVGIYTGIFTPTEAAAVVLLYSLLVSLIRRTIRIADLPAILADGVQVGGMIMMITVGALVLGTVATVLQIPQALQAFVESAQLAPWLVYALLVAFYLVLGMFLEVVSILLITLPIVYPLMISLHFNGVWFAIALVILMEMALITPPVGLNLFTVQGVTRAPLKSIIQGVLPFLALIVVVFLLVTFVQPLSTWLPGTMGFGR